VKQSGELRKKEQERERDQQINGERDGALNRNGNGVGQKWLLDKLNVLVFLAMQINCQSKLGGFQILQFFWCRNICYHNTMFCHKKLLKCPKNGFPWLEVGDLKFNNEIK
jgi:hypothetical protein